MSTKVYKSGSSLVVDDGLGEKEYYSTYITSYGFDGDVCWIKKLLPVPNSKKSWRRPGDYMFQGYIATWMMSLEHL